jgi:hypothetical protein
MCAVSPVQATTITFSGVAVSVPGITPIRDSFRAAIGGGTLAGANGSFGGVRREINWDGVPDAFAAPNLLPARPARGVLPVRVTGWSSPASAAA